ncbi:hypothetical protein GKC32_10710 (plasmid) [Lactobacillus curvatus]|nr:hypothetical protein [Latilactobacillus curvatus]MSD84708.1 hypothetical protein [Latilactobacillus curvatus]MSE23444.1 hypothetical protein [Latilactobacillus curvatus]MSE24908.1 hypothetical protein [Latilactobacillus curvatus]
MTVNYRDPTHIDIPDNIDPNHISTEVKQLAKWLREKMYGVDIREAIARVVEQISSDVYDDRQVADELGKLIDELNEEWLNTLNGLTQDAEVKNARIDIKDFVYKTLKGRLDSEQTHNVTHLTVANVDEIQTLRINGLTKASTPVKYANERQVNDAFNPRIQGLLIQSVSLIKLKKVSDIA